MDIHQTLKELYAIIGYKEFLLVQAYQQIDALKQKIKTMNSQTTGDTPNGPTD